MLLKSVLFSLSLLFISPTVELEKRTVMNNKIELLLPKDWKPMSEHLVQKKYPGPRPPSLVYSDITGGISIAFNHTDSKASSELLEKYKEALKAGLVNAYPDAVWEKEAITEINGKKAGVFEVFTETADEKIYNYMVFTDVDGRLMICSFNCTENRLKTWKPVAQQIMSSLKFLTY
jgi:hypothetical protein